MKKQKPTLKDAIVSVLQDADKPLDRNEITKIINERRLYPNGTIPNKVGGALHYITNKEKKRGGYYDESIRRVEPIDKGGGDSL